MKTRRLKLDPKLLACLAVAIIAPYVGVNLGLRTHQGDVLSNADWGREDRERFRAIVYDYIPLPIAFIGVIGTVLAWVSVPDTKATQQRQLKDQIQQRLAEDGLSESELLALVALQRSLEDG